MLAVLVLAFLAVPFVELFVIVQVAGELGVLNTIAALIVISLVGGWLCRSEGVAVFRRIQASLARGELPHAQVVDGGLILFAGALLLTPGFLTDVLAILLLLPPTRVIARRAVMTLLRRRVTTYRVVAGRRVHDVFGEDVDPAPERRPEPPSLDRP